MSTAAPVDTDLHLPDLRIRGFRGIEYLLISRLGRVTLLSGKNGVGKTTVLDAVKVYAARGRSVVLASVLWDREETVLLFDVEAEQEVRTPRWGALFCGREIVPNSPISVGPTTGDQLGIEATIILDQQDLSPITPQFPGEFLGMQVNFRDFKQEFPTYLTARQQHERDLLREWDRPPGVPCELLGPDLPNSDQLARFWDKVALTDEESRAVKALNLIYSNRVERIAMIGDDIGVRRSTGRKAVVKLHNDPRPVPLKSLGDGAVRLFGVALALANSKDGFLLIDEAENGIHHSIQRDFWTMILKAAHQNNVQVLATTHSWDCVAGFAMAASEIEEVDGALVRLEKKGDRLRAVEYPSYDLDVIAKQGIEVR